MAGAGYDIGVSASTANATSQNTSAATVFNFNSAGSSFDGGTQSGTPNATAVATTKSPGASTDINNPNARNPAVSGLEFLTNNPTVGYGLVAIALLAVGLWAYKKFNP